ncbi:hypothetical protein, variant [Spizellomyces punctatus DAOM BR117]|uniref:Glucosamine 6-phosphate N-acetyltransferase n=1 Tax=Spizellomyces punctatus (strain DAOM BR117) TaxID=645134 RepID=A0A0L0HML9_SPIPD|nr:hypothetical protein, variant [Spizellomyces punctatus DAOM BR117]KND02155.1 hypothetical protein, variant [Spizellomyces punctatus DAOM BR117]|eukprot:XP_016610194.1 hypothetical protein, variant [Spizellomyces punctatus DAOM BR117]
MPPISTPPEIRAIHIKGRSPIAWMASSPDLQFDPSRIPKEAVAQVPEGYTIRPLNVNDYDKGYLELLSQLTTIGTISKRKFAERFDLLRERNESKYCIVIEDLGRGIIVGAGSVIIEPKFVHECGMVGHIEDIVVDNSARGKNLGKLIINALTLVAKHSGAYKVILSCAEKNVGFYEKCGLKAKEVTMANYL